MRFRTTRYVTLPATAAILALTGCASSGSVGGGPAASSAPDAANPLKVIQAAYTTTTSAKTARTMVTFGVGVSGQHGFGGLTMNGVEDFALQNADETVSDVGNGSELRIIDDDVYLQIPKESDLEPGIPLPTITKPWVHIRVPDASRAHSASLAQIFGGSGPDPAQFVKLLTDVSTSVQRVGSDVIRGQQSTHYRLTFDTSATGKLNKQLGGCDDGSWAAKDTTPVDVWVDGQGRLTRMKVNEEAPLPGPNDLASALPSGIPTDWPSDLPSGWPTDLPTNLPTVLPTGIFGSGGKITISLTIEMFDYGTPVKITPPAANQTQDVPFAPEMLNQQTSSGCRGP